MQFGHKVTVGQNRQAEMFAGRTMEAMEAGNNFAYGYIRSTMQPEVFIFISIHQLH
jgi:hypothetical protein